MGKALYRNGNLQVATAYVHFRDPDGRTYILLGRRKHGDRYGNYTFPGGLIDNKTPPETPVDAALRELQEETNLNLTKQKHPFNGNPLKLSMELIHYPGRGEGNAGKDVHVVNVDLGQLSYEEIARLKQPMQAQDDLAQLEFIDAEERDNYSITRQNRIIIDNSLGQQTPRAAAPATVNPGVSLPSSSKAARVEAFVSNPKKYNYNARKQAEAIWQEQVEPLLRQGKSVGLVYPSNELQTQGIYNSYQTGKIDGIIQGSGQAPVFAEIAQMIEERNLQNRVHILPMTTSMTGGDNMAPNNQVDLTHINRDLRNVARHRADNWEIRGIANSRGGYAIGGGNSTGWFDAQKINISQQADGSYQQQVVDPKQAPVVGGISQGAYTERDMQIMAQDPIDKWPGYLQDAAKTLPPLVPVAPVPAHNKWSYFKQQAEQEKQLLTSTVGEALTVSDIGNNLAKGINLAKSSSQTQLDYFIHNKVQERQAADLLAMYAVKNVMGNLATQVNITMVDNSRSGQTGHDKHALKIQFNSQVEAEHFAEKLLREQGIHSLTYGKDVMKTAQKGAIYLTAQDLEKIAKNSKLAVQEGTGIKAYHAKVQGGAKPHPALDKELPRMPEDNRLKPK